MEFTDARGPGSAAGHRVVFVGVPETKAVGRIDRIHAVVTPTPRREKLGAAAINHDSFPLAEVIWRISRKASGVTDTGVDVGI